MGKLQQFKNNVYLCDILKKWGIHYQQHIISLISSSYDMTRVLVLNDINRYSTMSGLGLFQQDDPKPLSARIVLFMFDFDSVIVLNGMHFGLGSVAFKWTI